MARFKFREGTVPAGNTQPRFADRFPYLIPGRLVMAEDLFNQHSVGGLLENTTTSYPPNNPYTWNGAWSGRHNILVGGEGNKYVYTSTINGSAQADAVDLGLTNHQCCALFDVVAPDYSMGLLVRCPAGSGNKIMGVLSDSFEQLQILTNIDDEITKVAVTPMTMEAGQKYAMRLSAVGTLITVACWKFGSADDPVVLTATIDNSTLNTGTQAGLVLGGVLGEAGVRCLEFYAGSV